MLPVEVHGITFDRAGTAQLTLATTNGADSVLSVTLAVLPTSDTYIDTSILSADMPVELWGSVYNLPTDTTIMLTNAAGCDSAVHLHIAVVDLQPVTASADSTVTDTVDAAYMPHTYESTTYNHEVTNVEVRLASTTGCDSIVNYTLVVIEETPQDTIPDTPDNPTDPTGFPLSDIDSMHYRSSTIEINGVVRGLKASGMLVEALTDIKPMLNDSAFTLTVPASDHGLHWVMLVDQDSLPILYYRGYMTEGQTIVIDSASTAMALLLIMPQMQKKAIEDEARFDSVARNSPYYAIMCELIGQSVAAGHSLLDDESDTIYATLAEWVEELENATDQPMAITAAPTQFKVGNNTMLVNGVGRKVKMYMWDLNPAYYGTVSDADGNLLTNIRVPSRGDYGFMDLLSLNMYGESAQFDMQIGGEGTKHFSFSCKTLPAQIDFYTTTFIIPAISAVSTFDVINRNFSSCLASAIYGLATDMASYYTEAQRVSPVNTLAGFKESVPEMLSLVGDRVSSLLTSFDDENCIPKIWHETKFGNMLKAIGSGLKIYLKAYTVGKALLNTAGRCYYFYSVAPDTLSFCMEWGEGTYTAHQCTSPTVICSAGNGQQGDTNEWLPEPVTFSIKSCAKNGERSERHLTLHVSVKSGDGEISENEIDVITASTHDVQKQVLWKLGNDDNVPQRLSAWLTDPNQERVVSDTIEVAAFFYGEEERIDSFKVADDRYITFSPGNLQYQPSTDTWRFAEHQYDVIGQDNMNISNNDNTYSGWIDIFSWSTANMPTYVPSSNTLYDNGYNVFYDWGINPISNGGNVGNMWRTPTFAEWTYLMVRRDNHNDLYSYATVCDVHGMILLPDNWVLPEGQTFTPAVHNWTTNVYTEEQWSEMEAAGAIFLPAAGWRCITNVNTNQLNYAQLGNAGGYWSASGLLQYPVYGYTPTQNAYRLVFFGTLGNAPTTTQSCQCYFGQSVRLIRNL